MKYRKLKRLRERKLCSFISPEEIAKRKEKAEAMAKLGREIFWRVYPDLVNKYPGWAILIEPESGDYFLDPDPEVAFRKARKNYPYADILEKCPNKTGCAGRI